MMSGDPKSVRIEHKGEQKWAQEHQKGAKRKPAGAKMELKGAKREPIAKRVIFEIYGKKLKTY